MKHMQWLRATTQRAPLLTAALLLVLAKSVQFAIDSQLLFWYDSGAFLFNGLGVGFMPERSYAYGGLICTVAVPLHSLRAIVAMQIIMGGLTAWLLTFALIRFLRVRAWIAMLAGLVFAFGPEQVLYEHMVMSETTALLAMALFLVMALKYLEDPSPQWLVILSFLGVLLVSVRIVYLPVVLATAALLPLVSYFSSTSRQTGLLALALVMSCGSTALFQEGYRYLTGWLAGREPAYHYVTGAFLLAAVAPIVEPGDSPDVRVAGVVAAQNRSDLPLSDPDARERQLFAQGGLVARLKAVFAAEAAPAVERSLTGLRPVHAWSLSEQEADQAAQQLARAAIYRNPLGFLGLGLHNYLGYWRSLPNLRWLLPWENGSKQPPPPVKENEAKVIASVFGLDVSNQHALNTPSRRYRMLGRSWCVFLLLAPFLTGLAWWLAPANRPGLALLCFWSCLLLIATCLGGVGPEYRFLHPFSFTGLAAVAALAEVLVRKHHEFLMERIVQPQRIAIEELATRFRRTLR